jgi:hypothetical protein
VGCVTFGVMLKNVWSFLSKKESAPRDKTYGLTPVVGTRDALSSGQNTGLLGKLFGRGFSTKNKQTEPVFSKVPQKFSRRQQVSSGHVSPSEITGTVSAAKWGSVNARASAAMYLPGTRNGVTAEGQTMRADFSQIASRVVPNWVKTLDAYLLQYLKAQGLAPIDGGNDDFIFRLNAIKPTLQKVFCDKRVVTIENPTIMDETHIANRDTIPIVFAGMTAFVDNGQSGGAFLFEMITWFNRIQDNLAVFFACALKSSDNSDPAVLQLAGEVLLGQPMTEAVEFAARRCRRMLLAAADPDNTPHGICAMRYKVIKTWMHHFEGRVKEVRKAYSQVKTMSALKDMACSVDAYLPANVENSTEMESEMLPENMQDDTNGPEEDTNLSHEITRAGNDQSSDTNSSVGVDD